MKEVESFTRASSAEADARCAGRHLAQQGIPEEPRGKDADYGDAIHKALAGNNGTPLTVEQQDIVDSCRKIEQTLVVQYFGSEVEGKTGLPLREQRLWAESNGLRHSGQPDAIYRKGTKALIVDYKSLVSDIPTSPRNLQVRDYVVLTYSNAMLVNEIACAVIQPLVTHSPELCVYTLDDINQARAEMWERVKASNNPQSPRTPGEVQCRFCRAKMKCLEYQQWASAPLPALIRFDVPVENWSPEQRAAAAAALGPAEDLLLEVKQYLKALIAKDPDAVPGYYLKPGAVRKMVTNPQAVFDRFTTLGGSLEQYMGTLTVGKDKLKTQVAGVTGAKGKALDSAMDALLDGLIETTQAAPSLARKKE